MINHSQLASSDAYQNEKGNAIVIALVVLVIAAVGVLAFMSGKIGSTNKETAAPNTDVASEAEENVNPVIAILNGEELTRQDVIDLMNQMPPQMRSIPPEQLFPMAVEQIITNKLIDNEAQNAGLDSDEKVLEQLEAAKKQIIRTRFLEKTVSEGVSEDALVAKYDEYVANFSEVEEVKAAHILVDDEKLAKSIIKKLNAGEDFATLANENSSDGSSEAGGELGYFAQNEVVPEFAEAAFSIEPGMYSKKPVKSDFGYHIIRVDEKRIRPAATFEEVRPMLEQEMRRQVFEEKVSEWKASAVIERFDINGNPVPTQEVDLNVVPAEEAAVEEGSEEVDAE